MKESEVTGELAQLLLHEYLRFLDSISGNYYI